ncbi:MAG: AAA family ATPase [Microbacterium sp.]
MIRRARKPLLLDEWQRMPHVWDLVRRAVDEDCTAGQFLLTGSAAPITAPMHSGAGRIVSLRMRPLSMAERVTHTPTVSLATLMQGGAHIEGDTE